MRLVVKEIMRGGGSLAAVLGVLFCLPLISGCDDVQEFPQELAIAPSSVTLTPSSSTVEFTAVSNTSDKPPLPIEWSVSSPGLGSITSDSDYTAVYRSTGHTGQNTVIARDQAGNEATATVDQMAESSYTVSLTPASASLSSTADSTSTNSIVSITVQDGVAPYDWEVNNPTLGFITGDGSTVVYEMRDASGQNTVTVEDANGVSSSMAITQTFVGPGG